MDSIRPVSRHLQGKHWDMLIETSLQRMRTSSNDGNRSETWAFTSQVNNNLAVIHTKMKRTMLNITYRDRQTNIWVREKTKVTDVIEQVRRRKWTWAGHSSRIRDNRYRLRITTWKPYERKIPRGRLASRWRDELDDYWKGSRTEDSAR